MEKYTLPHIRLGGTSFLLHEEYAAALRFAAARCEDIALLLLQAGQDGELLPGPEEIREIGRICAGEGTSLHVHLPTDVDFSTAQGTRHAVRKVQIAIERAAPLAPHSFVLHVAPVTQQDAARAWGMRPNALPEAQRQWIARALAGIAASLPAPEMLAIENLETFQPDFWDCWLEDRPYSRCLDVGHLWKDGLDPLPILQAWLPRVRVIHLHGLKPGPSHPGPSAAAPACAAVTLNGRFRRLFGPHPRDHSSLRLMPADAIDACMHPLWKNGYAGTLVLEVFDFEAFKASHAVLLQSWKRYAARPRQ